MTGNILENATLSEQGFHLSPRYNDIARLPITLEPDDCIYDPNVDKMTASPERIGQLINHAGFSGHGYDCIDVKCLIKAPQSDVYHIPDNLAAFREAIQMIIDHEHNATPAAFTRAAYIAIRYQAFHATAWHFDAGLGTRTSRTYNVADKDPTRFATVPLRLSWWGNLLFSEEKNFLSMEQSALRALKRLPADEREGYCFSPYDIVRHGSKVLHRGVDSDRTLLSVIYFSENSDVDNDDNLMLPISLPASAPIKQSGQLLQQYMQKLQLKP